MVMFAPVDGPPARATGPNLVNSAIQPADGARWQNGFAWRPETCINEQGFMPCDPVGLPTDEVDNPVQYYEPPAFRVWDECTTLSTGPTGLDEARLRRQAEAVTSYEVAHELWTGELSSGSPATVGGVAHVNAFLADGGGTTVTVDGDTANRLRQLEQAAKQAAKGQQVVLHLPIGYLPAMDELRLVGDTLYTPLGSIVVADAGYPGTGPVAAGTSEVQTVTLSDATGGTFTLTFNGQTTTALAFNAASGAVAAALNALPNLFGVSVTGNAGGPWTVTFPATLGDVPQMTADASGLTGTGTSEVQTVTVSNATGGTYTLTYDGQTTAAIAFDADGAAVQAALNALSNLDGVTVAGAAGGPWTVTFPAALGDVDQMTIDGSALTDDGTTAHTESVATTTPGTMTAATAAVATTTPGVDPAPEAGVWAYATGLVQVRLDPIDAVTDIPATMDRTTNRQRIWAQRLFAAVFDPCVHLAAQLAEA